MSSTSLLSLGLSWIAMLFDAGTVTNGQTRCLVNLDIVLAALHRVAVAGDDRAAGNVLRGHRAVAGRDDRHACRLRGSPLLPDLSRQIIILGQQLAQLLA